MSLKKYILILAIAAFLVTAVLGTLAVYKNLKKAKEVDEYIKWLKDTEEKTEVMGKSSAMIDEWIEGVDFCLEWNEEAVSQELNKGGENEIGEGN